MNIVLIIVDTLRYDHVHAYSGRRIETPNMDRLSRQSWNFHRSFINSFPTIPFRTDVITGQHGKPFNPWRPLNPDSYTFPEVLAGEGYCTQLIHDTPHLVNGQHGFDLPFHAWMPVRGAEVDRSWIKDECPFPPHWKRLDCFDEYELSDADILENCNCMRNYLWTNGTREREEDWNVARLFSTASRFLRDNARRENFFLWIDCFDPHEPWDAPPDYVRIYDAADNPEGYIDPRSFAGPQKSPDLSDRARQHIEACYTAKTAFMDHWLGHFLDTMEATGLDRNTAIILTGDHGTNLYDAPGRTFGKEAPPLINEAHVPLMIATPEGEAGDCDLLVQPQDLYNTVLSMAGVPTHPGLDSYDILSAARKKTQPARNLAVSGAMRTFGQAGPDDILLSAYTENQYMYMTPDPQHCELYTYGDDSSHQNTPTDRESFYSQIVMELERQGMLRPWRKWLDQNGKVPMAESLGWTQYFNKRYKGR